MAAGSHQGHPAVGPVMGMRAAVYRCTAGGTCSEHTGTVLASYSHTAAGWLAARVLPGLWQGSGNGEGSREDIRQLASVNANTCVVRSAGVHSSGAGIRFSDGKISWGCK